MKYLIFITEVDAKAYSHTEAVKCGYGKPGDTIQYWWAWRETVDEKWAVECPEGTDSPEFNEVNEDEID